MATAAAIIEQGLNLYARNLEFVAEEVKLRGLRPALATPNHLRLGLRTMFLREYGTPGLGRKLNFGDIAWLTHLLVVAADDVTTPEQVLDAAKYLETPTNQIIKKTVPGGISASL